MMLQGGTLHDIEELTVRRLVEYAASGGGAALHSSACTVPEGRKTDREVTT